MASVSQKPTGSAAAEYQQSMQEQTPLFFNGEKSAEDVLAEIQRVTDKAIAEELSAN